MSDARWTIVDAHKCTRCGYLDQTRDGIMAHLFAATPCTPSAPWVSFPGKVPVCQNCGADWRPVQRGQCIRCGDDGGPLRKEWVHCGRGPCSSYDGHDGACER